MHSNQTAPLPKSPRRPSVFRERTEAGQGGVKEREFLLVWRKTLCFSLSRCEQGGGQPIHHVRDMTLDPRQLKWYRSCLFNNAQRHSLSRKWRRMVNQWDWGLPKPQWLVGAFSMGGGFLTQTSGPSVFIYLKWCYQIEQIPQSTQIENNSWWFSIWDSDVSLMDGIRATNTPCSKKKK